ncbi:MAG: O-antigen ligase family protein [Nocardioides sp.]|uniref:O-antigen ligase family protein n=1 Tax=Nocardioides sp. TaxID=35761 RepID=UPI003F013A77
MPDFLKRAAAEWFPVLVRERQLTTLAVLGIFLALQFLIPARLVISGMGAAGRPSVAVGLGLAFLWTLSAFRPHQLPSGRQPVRWVIGLFVAAQLLGYVIGFDRGPSALEASSANRWLLFVFANAGLALAVADGIRTRADLDRLLRLTVGLASAMAFVGILQYLRIVDLTQYIRIPGLRLNSSLIVVGSRGTTDLARVAGTASHYIEFGVVLALILPVALHYAFFAPPGRTRLLRWLMVGTVTFAIPLSISRSATLVVAVTFLLLATVWPWRHRYNVFMISLVALAGFRVLNPGVLGTIRSLFTNADQDPSVQDRISRTDQVMQLWEMRPWFGRGAGMVIPEQYLLLDNQFFGTLIAGGIFGVIVLLLLFLVPYGMARSVRLRGQDQETRHLAQALAVSMPAAILASGTFDSFSFPTFVGVMFLYIGAIGALWRLDGTTVERPLQAGNSSDRYVAAPLMARGRGHVALGPDGSERPATADQKAASR